MATKLSDNYTVLLKGKQLPLALIQDPKEVGAHRSLHAPAGAVARQRACGLLPIVSMYI